MLDARFLCGSRASCFITPTRQLTSTYNTKRTHSANYKLQREPSTIFSIEEYSSQRLFITFSDMRDTSIFTIS